MHFDFSLQISIQVKPIWPSYETCHTLIGSSTTYSLDTYHMGAICHCLIGLYSTTWQPHYWSLCHYPRQYVTMSLWHSDIAKHGTLINISILWQCHITALSPYHIIDHYVSWHFRRVPCHRDIEKHGIICHITTSGSVPILGSLPHVNF